MSSFHPPTQTSSNKTDLLSIIIISYTLGLISNRLTLFMLNLATETLDLSFMVKFTLIPLIAGLLSAIVLGILHDIYGEKSVLLVSILTISILFMLPEQVYLQALIFLAVLVKILYITIFIGLLSLATKYSKRQHHEFTIGIILLFIALGNISMPFFQSHTPNTDFHDLIIIAPYLVLLVLSILLSFFFSPPHPETFAVSEPSEFSDKSMKNTDQLESNTSMIVLAFFILFIIRLSQSALTPLLFTQGIDSGLQGTPIRVLMIVFPVAIILGMFLASLLSLRLSSRILVLLGGILFLFSFISFLPMISSSLVVFLLASLGVSIGILLVTSYAIIAQNTPFESRAKFMSYGIVSKELGNLLITLSFTLPLV